MKAVENALADVHVAVDGEEHAAGACFPFFLSAAISVSSSLPSLSQLCLGSSTRFIACLISRALRLPRNGYLRP